MDARSSDRASPKKRNRSNSPDQLAAGARFEQAKNPTKSAQFLQIVAKPKRAARKKPEPKLTRVAFRVSRLMEFCTRRELQNQTGHGVGQWPLVVLKELVDNALDACEEAEVAPVISIAVEPGSIVIEDNAGGIQTSTIKSILDYTIRVSSREAYVSPTRGAQGNALKTILAMGYVLDRERQDGNAEAVGVTIIETRGIEHQIEFRVDHVNNEPRIAHTTSPSPVKIGSRITISWPVISYYGGATLLDYARDDFIRLAEGYVWFNPHLTLRGSWYGKEFINVAATNPDWKKWGPRNPTSPHWYDETRLQRYLAAHVARDRDLRRNRTVREFIAEFRGLSGTAVQRKVLEEVGCSHQSLAAFFGAEQVNRAGIAKLLASMRKHTKPVAAKASRRHRRGSSQAPIPCRRRQRRHVQVPAAQGRDQRRHPIHRRVCFRAASIRLDAGRRSISRKFITGANWSVGISNPFRAFGSTGEGLESTLAKVRANATSPVICALHLASAYIQYADRGKSSIILTDNAEQPDD